MVARRRRYPFPRFRTDITATVQTDSAGQDWYILKDPWAGRYYRLKDTEYKVARLLTGHHDLEAVRLKLYEERIAVELQLLQAFVQRLSRLGLLEDEDGERRAERWTAFKPGIGLQGFRTNPTFVKFPIANPTPVLSVLAKATRLLYTRVFAALAIGVMMVAITLLWMQWGSLMAEMDYVVTPQGLIMTILTSTLVITFHEFAHAVTCFHFGGSVSDMGFALYLFQPYFYTDVSDAWMLPPRHRVWIAIAGPFFEAVLWAIAVFIWSATLPSTELHQAALSVVTASGIKLIWNLNPFLRLDGYYVLMDLLQVPNLRTRTLSYWVGAAKRLIAGRGLPNATKETFVFGSYGFLSLAFTVLVLLWLLLRLWSMLALAYPRYHQWVFLLLMTTPAVLFAIQGFRWAAVAKRVHQIVEEELKEER